jgi:Dolichyl-phosphate-mannose-protein mannosyltransferase
MTFFNTYSNSMTNIKLSKYAEPLIFLVVTALVVYVRLRFADMAFERDEGEYAYAGSAILRGGFPFKDFYNMKLPGVYYCYAFIFALGGKTVVAARCGVLILNLLSAALLIQIGKKWINTRAGWLAGAFYLFSAMSDPAQGVIANCEHFVVFFLLLTLWALSKEYFFFAGLCGALTIFMKQQGAILLVFVFIYVLYLLISKRKEGGLIKKLALLSGGFTLPFAVFLWAVWRKGVYASFKLFIIDYAQAYIGIEKPHYDFSTLYAVMNGSPMLWWAGRISVVLAIVGGVFSKKIPFKTAFNPLFLVLFFCLSYVSILPGWYYRPHYYEYIFPAAALLMAYGWAFFASLSTSKIFNLVYLALVVFCFENAIERQDDFLFKDTHQSLLIKMYCNERFHELRTVGEIVKQNSTERDTIGLMGYEPELAFYADRVSASGYLYSYPFVENQPYSMQMAYQYNKEIKDNKPKWFIDCFYWHTWAWFHTRIPMEDTNNFVKRNYFLRGALYKDTSIEWNIDSVETKREPYAIIYERRDSGQTEPTPLLLK